MLKTMRQSFDRLSAAAAWNSRNRYIEKSTLREYCLEDKNFRQPLTEHCLEAKRRENSKIPRSLVTHRKRFQLHKGTHTMAIIAHK